MHPHPNLRTPLTGTIGRSSSRHGSALHQLCTLVKPYLDIKEELLETPADRYRSQRWSTNFDQKRFPTSDHVHDFKTFQILHRNLEERKVKIMEAIRHDAFV
jgi:hypothetical protein